MIKAYVNRLSPSPRPDVFHYVMRIVNQDTGVTTYTSFMTSSDLEAKSIATSFSKLYDIDEIDLDIKITYVGDNDED